MNIFLPYENNIGKSLQSLDDKRLIKQILEVYQLLQIYEKEQQGIILNNNSNRGYQNHPIYKHYKKYPRFLYFYGYNGCLEYKFRFKKDHKYFDYFSTNALKHKTFKCTPFYMEGSKNNPDNIRTTENVSILYQEKLIQKWISSKYTVKWTNRPTPQFLQNYIKNS